GDSLFESVRDVAWLIPHCGTTAYGSVVLFLFCLLLRGALPPAIHRLPLRGSEKPTAQKACRGYPLVYQPVRGVLLISIVLI
ncbi:MAG: hypothetical protein ACRD88_11595, partial [Terriglobia bacterium]